MLKIGLTGGIGTGKSTVANIFKVLGAPVFEADAVAKQVMENDLNLREQLIQQFGAACFQNGQLNRAYLASIVFKDPYQLALLNAMVHPITLKAAADWMKLQTGPYAIKEAALIFEAGAGAGLDVIIGVTAPTAIRIQRVMQRDGISREAVLERMDKQIDESIKMRLCDFVIQNDNLHLLTTQVLDLHKRFIG
ncbi:MAG: dephospho-CoA kinase [Bacteroidetes bacterium 24-39-8]|jgi:dephospho-CoA kinase|nr:MAG: dephospho-CoA kinase [Sphingobacteriia bacterium 35-40-8]OYZ50608.1 MAG: dephospho-CoA kinase [Bacteroidetes bacterium 24-39-8]OZA67898.1 MAG: dephospho-CoA kinase [Sphingobacteriia bacterium 39-39-8]HQR93611.1 dephospho-CoA kinase [Sediminibacterium sp.]HQS55493.1 dephospho-CoA kinase [Sediminibacterium sp.]